MSSWEHFENDCAEYLEDKFGKYAVFRQNGGEDSTVSDIFVKPNSRKQSFFVEVKKAPAQCGQFVLFSIDDRECFEYSPRNRTLLNEYSRAIIEYMNNHFSDFIGAGTAGKEICMDPKIFASWIVTTYKSKDVKYFITNNYTVFRIDDLQKYFDISAKYRIKRSGSASVNPSTPFGQEVTTAVLNYIKQSDYEYICDTQKNGKLFVYLKGYHNGESFFVGDKEYRFSLKNSWHEIRRLSSTHNANVIFSVKLKQGVTGLTDSEFIADLS